MDATWFFAQKQPSQETFQVLYRQNFLIVRIDYIFFKFL